MRIAVVGGVIAALMLSGAAKAAEPSARMLELTERYMAAVHLNQLLDDSMKSTVPVMIDQMGTNLGLSDKGKAVLTDAALDVMSQVTPRMLDSMRGIVAETFTEEELTQAIAFYETPVGRSMLAKSPVLNAKMAPLLPAMMQDVQKLMIARVKKECGDDSCAALRAKPAN